MVRLMKKTDSSNSKIRSKWWEEIRNEVRRHASSLGCTHVIGYVEEVAAQDFEELTVMSGVGTAVTISPSFAKMVFIYNILCIYLFIFIILYYLVFISKNEYWILI